MSEQDLHPASNEDVSRLWPMVDAASLFDSRDRFDRFRSEAPWRVQITDGGEAALFERWRSHLDVLAVKGLWCAAERVPVVIAQLKRVARQQGFGRLLSPLVTADAARLYEDAGMTPCCAIVTLRYEHHAVAPGEILLPPGVRLRLAIHKDSDGLMRVDKECFDTFWRYDRERLTAHLAEDRIVVAESEEGVIGYTLAMVAAGSGILGRLAVRPSQRRCGVGEALLAEAVAYLLRTGAGDVSVCTQEENSVSRALYRRSGFAESPSRLVFLIGPAEAEDTS